MIKIAIVEQKMKYTTHQFVPLVLEGRSGYSMLMDFTIESLAKGISDGLKSICPQFFPGRFTLTFIKPSPTASSFSTVSFPAVNIILWRPFWSALILKITSPLLGTFTGPVNTVRASSG